MYKIIYLITQKDIPKLYIILYLFLGWKEMERWSYKSDGTMGHK